MKKIFFGLLIAIITPAWLFAQTGPLVTPADVQLWKAKSRLAPTLPISQRVIAIGMSFLQTPYQAHTLEVMPYEQLVVNLRGLDCTTFVETTLALAQESADTTFEGYCHRLQHLRYRRDTISSYPDRLHYLTDWLYENQQRGTIELITEQLGGQPYNKPLYFMTNHRASYRQLQDSANYNQMQSVERNISGRKLYYIPKAAILSIENKLLDGDLIAITTNIPGLDATHTGFAVWKNGRLHLLHASSQQAQVIVSPKPLAEYLAGNKSQTGIMVARVKGR